MVCIKFINCLKFIHLNNTLIFKIIGILKQLYARSQFTTCSENLISLSDIPQEKQISLRSAATEQSIGNGQGFFKCTCITKCSTNRCVCRKNGVLCNSKCHQNQSCTNFDK